MAFGVTGDKAIIRNLSTLAARTQRKILGKVIRRVQKPMTKSARKNLAPHKRTGQLSKALGTVIRKYKGISVWGVLGPRGGFRAELNGKPVDPIYYAHLLEGGHRIARGGKLDRKDLNPLLPSFTTGVHVGDVRPYPFLKPAFDEHKESAKKSAMTEISKEIEKEATRGARKK